jgi:hypothetical protein
MRPYYERNGIALYCGDCREVLPSLEAPNVLITDPVWPNVPAGLLAGWEDPAGLLRSMFQALPALPRQAVIVLRNDSDPRFLGGVPAELPFQQEALLQYAMPGYLGRVLGGNELAYVFGKPVASAPGRRVIPSIAPKAQPRDRPPNGHPCRRAFVHFRWLVHWFSDLGETVVDPFAGSGTTLRACYHLQRCAVGIELEERYCEIAARELDAEMAQGDLFRKEHV